MGTMFMARASPTVEGFSTIFSKLQEEHGIEKFTWTCMRQEPVIYVNSVKIFLFYFILIHLFVCLQNQKKEKEKIDKLKP